MSLFSTPWRWFNYSLNSLSPLGNLIVRLWLSSIFFMAGYSKIQTWDTTLFLFQQEYHVPVISPYWAAVLGTATELLIPILLVLGLGGRLPAFILFVFNIVIVFSYPFLWTDTGSVGLKDHLHWGLLLMLLMFHGNGRWSMDHLYQSWHRYR